MKTITFYSYKGGVGRTLALTNIANRLAEFNKKVCVLDFDLEAPGLAHKFRRELEGTTITTGIVDYVSEYYNNGTLPEKIAPFGVPLSLQGREAFFIPAGNAESNNYWKKLSGINWYDLLYESGEGVSFFLDLKEKIRQEINPDYLLIDSRTGITEISGITMSILADDVVILSANNRENIEGSKKIIRSLTNPTHSLLRKTQRITFVLTRLPLTDTPDDRGREQILLKRLEEELDKGVIGKITVIHSDRELELEETLKIGYHADEKQSQIARDYLSLFERITEGHLTTEEKQEFNSIVKAARMFESIEAIPDNGIKLKVIDEIIELNPHSFDYKLYKSDLLVIENRYDEAIELNKKWLKSKPDLDVIQFNLATLYILTGRYEKAVELLEKDSRRIRTEVEFILAAESYMQLGRLEKALEICNEAITLFPTESDLYNTRARMLRRLNCLEDAKMDVYKAIQLSEDNPVTYSTLCEIKLIEGNLEEFYINFEKALNLNYTSIQKSGKYTRLEFYIFQDPIYKQFYKEERFINLLKKYGIEIPETA